MARKQSIVGIVPRKPQTATGEVLKGVLAKLTSAYNWKKRSAG